MAASSTDLMKKLSRRWVGQIGSGGVADDTVATIPLSSTTNLPTDTGVVAVIDRVDSNGDTTSSKEETVIGVVSGSNLVSCTRGAEGTAQAHDAGAVVEILFTAKGWNDLVDGILVDHDQSGYHKTLTDANGNEWIEQGATASAVNQLKISNAATGNALTVEAVGDDSNIDLNIKTKGTGKLQLNGSTAKVDTVLDEDDMASDDANALATQQSIKKYVDDNAGGGNVSLFDNALINGNMDVWQRLDDNAAFTAATRVANNDDTYLMDRWILLSDGNDIVDVAKSTDKPDGSAFSAKFDVQTSARFGICQIIENKDALKLDNKSVSLSFYAKTETTEITTIRAAVLSWTSTADTVTSDVVDTWAATPTWAANWTAENTPSDITIDSAWTKYTIENIAIDTASMANIAVVIWTPNAEAIGDTLFLSQIMLNEGATAGTFMPRSFDDELRKCMKFYEQSWAHGVAQRNSEGTHVSSTNGYINFRASVRKRIRSLTSNVSIYNGSTLNQVRNTNTGATLNLTIDGMGWSSVRGGGMYDLSAFTADTYYDFNWIWDVEL